MPLGDLIPLLDSLGATREQPGLDVFSLGSPRGWFRRSPPDLEARQTRFLAAVLEAGVQVFWKLEDPPSAFDSALPWPEVASRVWLAPPGVEAGELRRRWLYTGNWQAFVAEAPDLPVPWIDPARARPDALAGFMAQARLRFLLDSFHDDYDWRIAFNHG